jgi:hypothetical protein
LFVIEHREPRLPERKIAMSDSAGAENQTEGQPEEESCKDETSAPHLGENLLEVVSSDNVPILAVDELKGRV